jgi:putative membrane protein
MLYPVVAGINARRAVVAPVRSACPTIGWIAAVAGIVGQIAYPLGDAATRTVLTGGTVTAFFVAMVAAACSSVGVRRGLAAAAVGCGLAWGVELVGLRTGLPFGRYSYTGSLRPTLGGVPAIVPLAWTALGLASLSLGRRLVRGRLTVALVGGGALASWDLFLDPQMVADGHWRWHSPQWTIPGVPGIPVSNFAGWLVVAVLLIGILDRVLPANQPVCGRSRPFGGSTADGVTATVYLWTYGSEVLAGIAFFHRPSVAVVGGVVMGAFAIPYARALRAGRQS